MVCFRCKLLVFFIEWGACVFPEADGMGRSLCRCMRDWLECWSILGRRISGLQSFLLSPSFGCCVPDALNGLSLLQLLHPLWGSV